MRDNVTLQGLGASMNHLAIRRPKAAVIVFAALALLSTAGLSGRAEAGDGWSKAPNTASSGDFAVLQIATTDSSGLRTEWQKSTPGVRLQTNTEATRNQPIWTFIIFKGCVVDAAGNCNVTVDYEVFDPTGKSYARTTSDVWVDQPPPPDLQLQLSVSSLGLRVEDKDPLGPYRVQAKVTDHVAKVTLKTEQVLTAVAN